jgi:hypothetical protein
MTKKLTVRKTDQTAPMVAQDHMKQLYRVLQEKVNERLEACHTEEEDGEKTFYEPPDLKWYLQEVRRTAESISKLEARREETMVKAKVDVLSIMESQSQLTREDRLKARKKYVEVEPDD